MKIARIETSLRRVPLTRPYTIALKVTDAVDMLLLRVTTDDGTVGLGSASPEPQITGETLAMCRAALAPDNLAWLVGTPVEQFASSLSRMRELHRDAPGACAAVDMALHDLRARQLGVPVVELLGRVHRELPTSITIGIKPLRETLEEADEYLSRGFRCLKVKIGKSLTEDTTRVLRLRDLVGPDVALRVDANQGYRPAELLRFLQDTAGLGIEFVEQPLPQGGDDALRSLPEELTAKLAADESLMDERDAANLVLPPRPFGTFVIKLMKCGGIAPALAIAEVAERHRIDLMWGCMDESAIGIAAALHAAFACPRTRYLDLDGSLDLAQDFARGGFELRDGVMRTLDLPGLGVALSP